MSAYSISQHLLCAEARSVRICACACVSMRLRVCPSVRVCDSWPPWAQCYFADPSHLLRVTGIKEIQVYRLISETMGNSTTVP